MKIDPKEVQRLRAETNAGVMDCKRALEDAQGDFEKAKGILKERGLASLKKNIGREAKEGTVASYIHAGGRVGAIVEIASETDFVSRGEDFQKLAQEVAMHVAAMDPKDIDELLSQAYIRDASKTINDLVTTLAASVGNSEEFVGLRDYRPGDPLQRIHWKSYARIGEPVVREYQDEYFERHALILDTFAGADRAAAFEEAVSIASSLACTVNTQECLLDLMFVGAESYIYTAGRGQMTTGSLLEVLAGVQLCANKPFRTLQDAVTARRGLLTGSICILLTWDEARREFIRTLRSLGVPLMVLVVSAEPIEAHEPWLHVIVPGKVQEGLASL